MPKRILIADDHESTLRRVRGMLEAEAAWEVCGDAVNGRDAVEKAFHLKPDLVILDFAMPQLDGLKAASTIHELLPDIPIVMFTLYGAQLNYEMRKHGISRLVDKSKSCDLVTAVQELLDTQESQANQSSSGPILFPSSAPDTDSQKAESGPITKAS